MFKKSLALSVGLALALPFAVHAYDFTIGSNSDLYISGLLAVGEKESKVTGSNRGTENENRLDDNTSRLTVGGGTKVNDSLKIIFRVESRFQADDRPGHCLSAGGPVNSNCSSNNGATGWADGDTWVGFASPTYGSIVFGKNSLYYADTIALPNVGVSGAGDTQRVWDVNGFAAYNILGQVGGAGTSAYNFGITRSDNVIRWDSPVFNGFDGSIAYTKNPYNDEVHCNGVSPPYATAPCTQDYAHGGTWYGRVRYNNGPLTASLSAFNIEPDGVATNAMNWTGYRLGVAYTFPIGENGLKVGAVWDNQDIDNFVPTASGFTNGKRNAYEVPFTYIFGNSQAYVIYAKANATSNVPDSGATQINLGYDYGLAKNAFVGVIFTRLINQSNGTYRPFLSNTSFGPTAPNTGEGSSQISLDLNYWF